MCVGGLGGGHQATYMKSVMAEAKLKGFQVVFLLFRATGDMPVQSDKMYCLLSWKDVKEPSDYLFKTYCEKQGRRMYLYSCSLGGGISTHYLMNDDANTPYSGSVSYGTPMNPAMTVPMFKTRLGGLYDWGLGFHLNLKIREQLPFLAKHTTKEKMAIYTNGLYNESFRLTSIDSHIIAPMFGFKDSAEYYRAAKITGNLHKITKAPAMFLQSWDDILMIPESFPVDEFKSNPNLLLAMTARGGHCCHLTHSSRKLTGFAALDWLACIFPSSKWFAYPIVDFLATIE